MENAASGLDVEPIIIESQPSTSNKPLKSIINLITPIQILKNGKPQRSRLSVLIHS
jgi:hypothetical protein